MTAAADDQGPRYWAFISYSHKDAGFGSRLHRRLESYVLPRRLVGRPSVLGPTPRRLVPIFRDREELSAADDLTAEVRAALQASRNLIVVCSPAAASSVWVSREVELFRDLHPGRPILVALRQGGPGQSLPEALRRVAADGSVVEPLAADFRAGQDGAQLGLLKLVAGVVGIRLDELVQRDSSRRVRRVMAVTAAAVAGMLLMIGLTIFALNSRADAVKQRAQAEGLVEYMLTDLRDRLKGVGRLDLMTAVDERALKYYADQNLKNLPMDSLERRARVLHAMGEDDETAGHLDAALAVIQEASRTTAALLASSPNDPERIFAHAQSVFWTGSVQYERHDIRAATLSFRAYKLLADRLVAIAPNNPKYRLEAGFADGNLCAIALAKPQDPAAALRYCSSTLTQMQEAARHLSRNVGIIDDIINAHAWLADAYFANGNWNRANAERLEEEHLLDQRITADPKNMDLKETWVVAQRALALIEERSGRTEAARARLRRVLAVVENMIRFDPKNRSWGEDREMVERNLSELH